MGCDGKCGLAVTVQAVHGLGEAVQIKTAGVLKKYADVSRHIPCLQRLGKRKSCNDQSS